MNNQKPPSKYYANKMFKRAFFCINYNQSIKKYSYIERRIQTGNARNRKLRKINKKNDGGGEGIAIHTLKVYQ